MRRDRHFRTKTTAASSISFENVYLDSAAVSASRLRWLSICSEVVGEGADCGGHVDAAVQKPFALNAFDERGELCCRQVQVKAWSESSGDLLCCEVCVQLHAEAPGGTGDVFVGGVIGVDGLGAHECVELDEAWGCGVVFHDPGQGVEQAVLNDESRAPLRLGLLPSGQYRLEEGILGAEVMAQQRSGAGRGC